MLGVSPCLGDDAMTTAVLYARVSDEKQGRDDRNSLPVQRERFLARCAERGYVPLGEPYVDVESGRRVSRKSYQRLLEDARRHMFDVVVVTFLDRFGRDQWETMRSLAELRSLGIDIEATEEDLGAFVDDSQRFLMTAFRAWGANEESKKIGMRVKIAAHRAVREGVAMGSTPYGYLKDRSTGKVVHVPDPDTAPIIRAIFEMYAHRNMSFMQIRDDLNRRDVPSPNGGAWSDNGVGNLLSRPAYVGDVVWGESYIRDAHEPIVTRELFEAVQRRRKIKGELSRGKTQRSHYLLSGIIYCAHCGGRMEGNTSHASPGKKRPYGPYRRYNCKAYRIRRGCEHRNQHDADKLEAAVIRELGAHMLQIDELTQQAEDELATRLDEFEHVERRLREIPERFAKNMQLYERGVVVSEAQLAIANQRLDDEERMLQRERVRLLEAIEDAKTFSSRVERMPRDEVELTEYLEAMTVAEQKAELQEWISRIDVTEYDYNPHVQVRV